MMRALPKLLRSTVHVSGLVLNVTQLSYAALAKDDYLCQHSNAPLSFMGALIINSS